MGLEVHEQGAPGGSGSGAVLIPRWLDQGEHRFALMWQRDTSLPLGRAIEQGNNSRPAFSHLTLQGEGFK